MELRTIFSLRRSKMLGKIRYKLVILSFCFCWDYNPIKYIGKVV